MGNAPGTTSARHTSACFAAAHRVCGRGRAAPSAGDGQCRGRHLRGPAGADGSRHKGRMSAVDGLQEALSVVADDVQPWHTSGFVFVRNLQDAVRNHGCVDLMTDNKDGDGTTRVAVKRMPNKWVRGGPAEFQQMYPNASEKPWVDIAIVMHLNALSFPFVCEQRGVFRDEENTYVVSSLASEGDLFGWCDREPPPGRAREDCIRPLAAQVFSAVRWIHDLGVAHRDLSLENILLTINPDGTESIKLIDFGMATLRRTARKEVRGKQSYQAPEMHSEEEYDCFLTDEFSLGVVLYAMAAQDYPWTSTKRHTCKLYEYVHMYGLRRFLSKRRLRKGSGEQLLEVFTPDFVDVIECLLEREPKKRATLGEDCFEEGRSVMSWAPGRTRRRRVWELRWLDGYGDVCRREFTDQ